jgi:hypothetical protein
VQVSSRLTRTPFTGAPPSTASTAYVTGRGAVPRSGPLRLDAIILHRFVLAWPGSALLQAASASAKRIDELLKNAARKEAHTGRPLRKTRLAFATDKASITTRAGRARGIRLLLGFALPKAGAHPVHEPCFLCIGVGTLAVQVLNGYPVRGCDPATASHHRRSSAPRIRKGRDAIV